MKTKEKKWIRFRMYLVAAIFIVGLTTVLARAYQLQVLEKGHLSSIAQQGYVGTINLPPKRGTIFDREGHELAITVEVASVYAHPNRIADKNETARQLAKALREPRRNIYALLKKSTPFVWLKRRMPPSEAQGVQDLKLQGVGVTTEPKRYYPGKELAAHLLGFVGMDNLGLEGLEKRYDRLLSGSQYSLIQMRDALGRLFSISRPSPLGIGTCDLILTIDKDIQYKAQQALREAVDRSKAKAGHCLVLDPNTGEILAMAVVPEFNPNIFTKFRPEQWRNRIITDCYEPGSTMKAFLLAAALEESVVTPGTQFDCEHGRYAIGRNAVRDTHEHDVLTVREIISYSSNIGAIKIGEKLGYETYSEYLRKFGFGAETGMGLLGEREGFIRPPDQARPIDRATMFFGQGMTTTSLQLAVAMAAIANGGKLMRPYVVKAVVDESGKVVSETNPSTVRRVISEKTALSVANVLEGVVSEKGTGARAAIAGFRVAGKTGTSQKVDPKTRTYSDTKYASAFVGFTPVVQPRLLILVVVDEPKGVSYGGVVAGPVFREVGRWSLNHMRVTPQVRLVESRPGGFAQVSSRVASVEPKDTAVSQRVKAGMLPDFRGLGMREVLRKGKALGLKVKLEGTGLAVRQDPGPGLSLKEVKSVTVSFEPPV